MFTGLVEAIGTVCLVAPSGAGVRLGIDVTGLRRAPVRGASIAVNGACLTVTDIDGPVAFFDAVRETARRTTLASLRPGARVNLEGALCLGDALDGHMVLGHVDATGVLQGQERLPGSVVMRFSLPEAIGGLVAEKGSVAVAGVSLTVVDVDRASFSVSLIPETLARTTLGFLASGDAVNLEADVLARYVLRMQTWTGGGLTLEKLRAAGF